MSGNYCLSKRNALYFVVVFIVVIVTIYLNNFLISRTNTTNTQAGFNQSNSVIIGGTDVAKGEYPYVAHIYSKFDNIPDRSFGHCTGVFLNKYWLLTAKHCIVDISINKAIFASYVLVLYDSPDISNKKIGIDYDLKSSEFFPYIPTSNSLREQLLLDDFILVKFINPANIDVFPYVPNTIFTYLNLKVGQSITLLGYGCREPAGHPTGTPISSSKLYRSNKLRKISLPLTLNIDNEARIFVGYSDNRNYTSTACVGDSGGPALIEKKGGIYLIGLAVGGGSGSDLANVTVVNTTKFKSWIENTIRTNSK